MPVLTCWTSHQLVIRLGCVGLSLTPRVSCCDENFNCKITAKALTMWAPLGSGGPKTVSSSVMLSYRSLKKCNLESWGRFGFGFKQQQKLRNSTKHLP